MDSTRLIEDFETGFFKNEDGNSYICCDFDPNEQMWIEANDSSWSVTYKGSDYDLDWESLSLALPNSLINAVKPIVALRLKKNAPSYLEAVYRCLFDISESLLDNEISVHGSFSGITSKELLLIWNSLNSHPRSTFRSLYTDMANSGVYGAHKDIAKEMKSWKARNDVKNLDFVTSWNAERGAFTSAEWELVRNELEKENKTEKLNVVGIKIFARIVMETLKRPQQIASMKKDALLVIESSEGLPSEYFLRIPKAKAQTGDKPGLWQITESLGLAIETFSKTPTVSRLQNTHNRLITIPAINKDRLAWQDKGQLSSQDLREMLRSYFARLKVISPRTNKAINLTPYRIRHTGATALALQGFPRDQIQEVLEHDSPLSADAYIHAAGSDLMPAIEKISDRGAGKIFEVLKNTYFFKGKITDEVGDKPITIPVTIVDDKPIPPAVVGSCNNSSSCKKHPFWACYNGCEHFLAWDKANHKESFEYLQKELKRWGKAEGGKERSKLFKDFERTARSVQEVINLTSSKEKA